MKIARYIDSNNVEQLGVLEGDRLIAVTSAANGTDLVPLIAEGDAAMKRLQDAAEAGGDSSDVADVKFLSPLKRPGKILAIGANYPSHVKEIDDNAADEAVSAIGKQLGNGEYPPAFCKMVSSVIGHNGNIVYAEGVQQLDYEAELAFVIGPDAAAVSEGRWRDAIAGYLIANDVSARNIQFREMKRGMLTMGKNLPGFTPMGPYFVTADEISDPLDIQIVTRVNGEVRQNENTGRMLFKLEAILEYYAPLGLEPGDIFLTGSPAGVAAGMPDPENYYMNPGDVVEIEMTGLGTLRSTITAP